MRLGNTTVAVLLILSVARGGAQGDDTVKSTKAATAAQKDAFKANAAKFGVLAFLKALIIVEKDKLCQGKFKAEGFGANVAVPGAKTFFKNNGQTFEGVIIEEGYLDGSASEQIMIGYQELLRSCYGYLRQPPPTDVGLGNDPCKALLEKAHKLANSAIDAAQDAQNRAKAKNLNVPQGVNAQEFQKEVGEFCAGARAAYNLSVAKKKDYKKVLDVAKGMNMAAPPAAPTPAQQYVLDGYRRMCRSQTIALRALVAAGK